MQKSVLGIVITMQYMFFGYARCNPDPELKAALGKLVLIKNADLSERNESLSYLLAADPFVIYDHVERFSDNALIIHRLYLNLIRLFVRIEASRALFFRECFFIKLHAHPQSYDYFYAVCLESLMGQSTEDFGVYLLNSTQNPNHRVYMYWALAKMHQTDEQIEKAIDYYKKCAGKSKDIYLKARAYYELGCLYADTDKIGLAKHNLSQFCLLVEGYNLLAMPVGAHGFAAEYILSHRN